MNQKELISNQHSITNSGVYVVASPQVIFPLPSQQVQQYFNTQKDRKCANHPSFINNDQGFKEADWDLAVRNKNRQQNRFQNNEQVPFSIDKDFFQQYGPGTYLFFELTRKLGIMFCIISVLTIPALISNFRGNSLPESMVDANKSIWMKFAISNQPQGQQNNLYYYLVLVPDLVYSLTTFIFLLLWSAESEKIAMRLRQNAQLPSYFTVEITNHNPTFSIDKIEAFMSKFGSIHEISAVKNFEQSIYLSKKMLEMATDIQQTKLSDNPCEKHLIKLTEEYDKLREELKTQLGKQKDAVIKFFVTFKNIVDRNAVVKRFAYYDRLCLCCIKVDEQLLCDGVLMKVRPCRIQPGSILWENVHISNLSRLIRWVIQFLLLILALFIGFLFLSFLNMVGHTYSSTSSSISAKQSWCLEQKPSELYSNQTLLSECLAELTSHYAPFLISVVISLSVIVIKSLLKIFLTFLSKFHRYFSLNQQASSLVLNLFLTYTCTTFLITFLLQANIFNVSFKNIIIRFIKTDDKILQKYLQIQQYDDLKRLWYSNIGYQILLNWLVLTLVPHIIQPLALLLEQKIAEWRAKIQKFQRNMEKMIEGAEFQFEDCYANVLMIVFVSMMLGGPMPILMLLGAIALGSRYLFWKYYFIRFCKIPPTFDQSLNSKVMSILPWSLIVHLAVSIYAYGNPQIFKFKDLQVSFLSLKLDSTSMFVQIIQRLRYNWPLTILLCLIVVSYFFKAFFVDVIRWFIALWRKDKVPSVMIKNSQEFTPSGDKDFVTSYRMESNKQYEDIMAILDWYSKKV